MKAGTRAAAMMCVLTRVAKSPPRRAERGEARRRMAPGPARKSRGGENMGVYGYTVMVQAPKGELKRACEQTRALFLNNNFRLEEETLRSFSCSFDHAPDGFDLGLSGRSQTHGAVAHGHVGRVRQSGASAGRIQGSLEPGLLMMTPLGQVITWDPFESETNYNIAVAGQSGSGKSVFLQEVVLSILGCGGAAIVVDDGYSFKNTCSLLGGSHQVFRGDGSVSINPFSLIDPARFQADEDYKTSVQELLTSMVIAMASRKRAAQRPGAVLYPAGDCPGLDGARGFGLH